MSEAPPSDRKVAAIVLAAGGSSRMGRPKQVLEFHGTSLLRRACSNALLAALHPVVVVLGADEKRCREEIADLGVIPVRNSEWAEGMGASLRCGLAYLLEIACEIEGVMVLLADQPLIEGVHLTQLLAAWSPADRSIAAAKYGAILGAPALFGRRWFGELAVLPKDAGARVLLARHLEHTAQVSLPTAACDVDTPEDFERLSTVQPTSD